MGEPVRCWEAAGSVVDVHEAAAGGHDPNDPRYDRAAWLAEFGDNPPGGQPPP